MSIGPTLAAIKNNYFKSTKFSTIIHQYGITEDIEVINIINSLNNSSPGWDGIPSLLAKNEVINLYIKLLTFIINQYFHDGIFTDELKLAKIIPIYKSGSTMELSIYRPISVFNISSKSFERLMYNRLIQFLH